MQRPAPHHQPEPNDPSPDDPLHRRYSELGAAIEESGILSLFDDPVMISMRLPNRPHPVACSIRSVHSGSGAISFDLQIGGLSARFLAITGRTTYSEADIIGTTLSFYPGTTSADSVEFDCPACAAEEDAAAEFSLSQCEVRVSLGRHPGKAPHEADADEIATMAFAFEGLLAAFRASELCPTDVAERPEEILEITVSGTLEELLARDGLEVSWARIPFEPIRMPPFASARLNPKLRRKPHRSKRSWILHMHSMNVSDAGTRDTVQVLFALDARTGDIVHQEPVMSGTSDKIGRALEVIIDEAGYRPGSAITTSPRLDDIVGEGLQALGVRYVRGRRLKATDPRVQDLEGFMCERQLDMMADMMADPGYGPPDMSL